MSTCCSILDVLCWDQSRVKLRNAQEDYIHASYVDGYYKKKEFICAQGPLDDTVEDFWEMVWDQKVGVIVQLTKRIEDGRIKVSEYWNAIKGKSTKCGRFSTRTLEQRDTTIDEERILMSDLLVRRAPKKNDTVSVLHLLHMSWPDHASPPSGNALIETMRCAREKNRRGGPILIHCSAGIGRTGTLVSIDVCVQRLLTKREVNVEQVVRRIRSQRKCAVQTANQYCFIHKVMLELIQRAGQRIPNTEKFYEQYRKRFGH